MLQPKQPCDLLIHRASQLITCASAGGPKRGAALAQLDMIEDGAVAIADDTILAVGSTAAITARYTPARQIDASGKVVCPGFIDPHTHLVFAGERSAEFEMKLAGAAYLEILQAGGGILSTMRATRAASADALLQQAQRRLDRMLRWGTTTVEVKTGYGLDTASELKLLAVIGALAVSHPCEIVPTFLAAHAVPPEFSGQPEAYIDLVVAEMIPAAAAWYEQVWQTSSLRAPFCCDVFCEKNVFDSKQSQRVLEAGLAHGMKPKIHADEFVNLGGVSLAIELGALSADHLDVTPPAEIAQLAASPTVAVVLPVVNYHLGSYHYAPARALIEAGAALALATDLNPGSAPCFSMPFVMALACRYQKLTPAEAFNASTINAAYAIGLGERLGSIEAGKQADLLLIDAPDYRHIAYWLGENLVAGVVKRGKIVHES
jgi:imidazolonepropionase